MRILSYYKDYYDYIARKYNGGDKSVTYVRNRLGEPLPRDVGGYGNISIPDVIDEQGRDIRRSFAFGHQHAIRDRGKGAKAPTLIHHLVFCGRILPIVVINDQPPRYEGGLPQSRTELYNYDRHKDYVYNSESRTRDEDKLRAYMGTLFTKPLCEDAIAVSKILKHPVFEIDTANQIRGEPPHLGSLGMGQYLSAEQCYQEVAMFVGNLMLEPPDAAPPVQVDEKVRLVKKGFDLKTSFRKGKGDCR